MLDFAKFMDEAKVKIERTALEMADHYGTLKFPLICYFIITDEMFLPSGKRQSIEADSIPAPKLEAKLNEAEAEGYTIEFDKSEQAFTVWKVFNDGKRRVITYAPYDKDMFDIKVHP